MTYLGMAQILELALKMQEDAFNRSQESEDTQSRRRRISSFINFTASTITSLNDKGPR